MFNVDKVFKRQEEYKKSLKFLNKMLDTKKKEWMKEIIKEHKEITLPMHHKIRIDELQIKGEAMFFHPAPGHDDKLYKAIKKGLSIKDNWLLNNAKEDVDFGISNNYIHNGLEGSAARIGYDMMEHTTDTKWQFFWTDTPPTLPNYYKHAMRPSMISIGTSPEFGYFIQDRVFNDIDNILFMSQVGKTIPGSGSTEQNYCNITYDQIALKTPYYWESGRDLLDAATKKRLQFDISPQHILFEIGVVGEVNAGYIEAIGLDEITIDDDRHNITLKNAMVTLPIVHFYTAAYQWNSPGGGLWAYNTLAQSVTKANTHGAVWGYRITYSRP